MSDILKQLHWCMRPEFFHTPFRQDDTGVVVTLGTLREAADEIERMRNIIEVWAEAEYRDGVSAGAAARQLCSTLGANGCAPTLKRMLEDMLAEFNQEAHKQATTLSTLREVVAAIPKSMKN